MDGYFNWLQNRLQLAFQIAGLSMLFSFLVELWVIDLIKHDQIIINGWVTLVVMLVIALVFLISLYILLSVVPAAFTIDREQRQWVKAQTKS